MVSHCGSCSMFATLSIIMEYLHFYYRLLSLCGRVLCHGRAQPVSVRLQVNMAGPLASSHHTLNLPRMLARRTSNGLCYAGVALGEAWAQVWWARAACVLSCLQ